MSSFVDRALKMPVMFAAAVPLVFLAPSGRHPASVPPHRAPSADVVVSTAWLGAHLHDRDVVIIELRGRTSAAMHVPGAIVVASDTFEHRAKMEMSGPMNMDPPTAQELNPVLEGLGIADKSHVVVVFEGADPVQATRVIFLLTHGGVDHVSLLDGGLAAWTRAGLPVNAAVATPTATHLALHQQPLTAVDFDFMQAHLHHAGFQIVDARAPTYYSGAAQTQMAMLGGHIPGAVNMPYTTMTDSLGEMLPPAALLARFRAAGVHAGDTVLVYCHVGYQGTMVTLAARSAGIPVRLYAGSFHDWSSHKGATEGGR